MSLKQLIASLCQTHFRKPAETLSYEDVFSGPAYAPIAGSTLISNYLPGLAPVQNEIDTYFKEVFAGPVF